MGVVVATGVFVAVFALVLYGIVDRLRDSQWRGGELVLETVVGVAVMGYCVAGLVPVARLRRGEARSWVWLLVWMVGAVVLAFIYGAFYFALTDANS